MCNENKNENSLTYEYILGKVEEIYPGPVKVCKLRFYKIGLRFQLEYANDWEEQYAKFIGDFIKGNFEKLSDENVFNELLSDENVFKYLSENPLNPLDLNEHWKNNTKGFFDILIDYRGNADTHLMKYTLKSVTDINVDDKLRYIYEIIQNADDCQYVKNPDFKITLNEKEGEIEVEYNEIGMTYSDIISITTIGQSSKKDRKKRLIGEKGVGFKTIFGACTTVDINSGGYHFKLNGEKFEPKYIEDTNPSDGTILKLKLNTNTNDINTIYNSLKEKYGFDKNNEVNEEKAFQECPIMFTNKLNSIEVIKGDQNFKVEKIINDTNDTNKINKFNVKYTIKYEEKPVNNVEKPVVVEKPPVVMEYYSFKKDVEFSYEEYVSRYNNQFADKTEYQGLEDKTAITYPIVLVAPKEITTKIEGALYSYLPTATKINAPIIAQIPLKLNINRSRMYFVGDGDTAAGSGNEIVGEDTIEWNKKLIYEFKNLLPKFYNELKLIKGAEILKYIPYYRDTNHNFFKEEKINDFCRKSLYEEDKSLYEYIKSVPFLKVNNSVEYVTFDKAIMFDEFIMDTLPFLKVNNSVEYVTFDNAIMFDEFIMDTFEGNYYDALCSKMGTFEGNYYDALFSKKEENKKKPLVEFVDLSEIYSFGFKLFEIKEENKTELLNEVLIGKEPKVIEHISHISQQNKNSYYIPQNIDGLKIFPAKREQGIEYTTWSGNFWFQTDTEHYSEGKICFIDKSFIVNKKFINKSEGIIPDFADLKSLNNITNLNQTVFEEFLELMARIEQKSNWYEYTKEFLNTKELYEQYPNLLEEIKTIKTNETNKNLWICLKILAHSINKSEYTLPSIKDFDEEICNVLNSTEFGNKQIFTLSDTSELPESELQKVDDDKIKKLLNAYSANENENEIYIYPLPDNIDYVRFTGVIILKNNGDDIGDDITNACAESIRAGLTLFVTFDETCKTILNGEAEENGNITHKTITDICAIQSHFTADNNRPILGSDHDTINELLQNANDKIEIVDDGVLNINYDDKTITFNYHEKEINGKRGFTLKDFMSISTSGNSGNFDKYNNHNGSTGKKGTGFKSVYNYFEKVEITSYGVKCTLDDTQYKKTKVTSEEIVYGDTHVYETDDEKRSFPVPYFDSGENVINDGSTTLNFTFKKPKEVNPEVNPVQTFIKTLQDKEKILFLNNVKTIIINGVEFDREKHIADNYYKITNDNTENDSIICEVLFPKLPTEVSLDAYNKFSGKLYVGLPVDECTMFSTCRFHVNIPSIELEDHRKSISTNPETVNKNNTIIDNFWLNTFALLFEKLEKIDGVGLENLYKYFPYEVSKHYERYGKLKEIPFIKTKKQPLTEETMCINNWENNEFLFFPKPLYNKQLYNDQLYDYLFNDIFDFKTCEVSFVWYNDYDNSQAFNTILFEHYNEEDFDYGDERIQTVILAYFNEKFKDGFKERVDIVTRIYLEVIIEIIRDRKLDVSNTCIKWYFGADFCESGNLFYLDGIDSKITIDGYTNIAGEIDSIKGVFCLEHITLEIIKKAIPKIRNKMYFHCEELVNSNDDFLNKFFEVIKEKSTLYNYNKELRDYLKENTEEEAERLEKVEKVRALFNNEKIIVQVGSNNSETYKESNTNLFSSKVVQINADYILKAPEEFSVYTKNLDYIMNNCRLDQLKDLDLKDRQNIFMKYIYASFEWKWDSNYHLDYLDLYNKFIIYNNLNNNNLNVIKFRFTFDTAKPLDTFTKQRCNDLIAKDKLESSKNILDKSLSEIIEKDILIEEATKGNHWTIDIGKEKIILIGKNSMGKMLKELFDCDSYMNPRHHTKIPTVKKQNNHIKWADDETIDFDNILKIESDTLNNLEEKSLKNKLVGRYTIMKGSKINYVFKGYGSRNDNNLCPVCDGKILTGLTGLKIKWVQLYNVTIPLLLCESCASAFSYSTQIRLCKSNRKPFKNQEEFLEIIKSKQPIKVIFKMATGYKTEALDLDLTFLHRIIILNKFNEQEEQEKQEKQEELIDL